LAHLEISYLVMICGIFKIFKISWGWLVWFHNKPH
jgi:hypothetical protein